MSRPKPTCECGRPAVATATGGRASHFYRGRKFRPIPGHSLCPACWRRQADQMRAAALAARPGK